MNLLQLADIACTFVGYGVVGLLLGNVFANLCVLVGKPVIKVVQSAKMKNILNSINLSGSKLS